MKQRLNRKDLLTLLVLARLIHVRTDCLVRWLELKRANCLLFVLAELKRRQERNMELAKQRKEKFVVQAQKKNERDRRLSDLLNNAPEPMVERDPARLLNSTKASEAARVYSEDLDAADRRRSTGSAHSSAVAMSGRDLQFAGRAKPVWMRPPK